MAKSPKARPKASRPDVHPLGEHLAALLNPALNAAPGLAQTPPGLSEAPAQFEHPRGLTGATATLESLKELLENGDPNLRGQPTWTPHRPSRPEKSEGGRKFNIVSEFDPKGDQPEAIRQLVEGVASQSAIRCCSASPAPARPSPWPR